MSDNHKAGVSVSEMARMVGLSRARFYQLMGTTFPSPLHDPETNRPFYSPELQEICLEARRRNCGIDGKPVLFYARRMEIKPTTSRRSRKRPVASQHVQLLEGLKSLGLVDVTIAQVEAAIKRLYPSGVNGHDEGEVLRAVFLAIKRQDSADNLA